MRKLPFHDYKLNEVWLELVLIAHNLIIWTQTLLLHGDLAKAEPKRLRYRLLHVAARLALHARQARLRLQASWPWQRSSPPRSPDSKRSQTHPADPGQPATPQAPAHSARPPATITAARNAPCPTAPGPHTTQSAPPGPRTNHRSGNPPAAAVRAHLETLTARGGLETTRGYLHHTRDELERSMLAPERDILDAAAAARRSRNRRRGS
jgi:hypothetical protein